MHVCRATRAVCRVVCNPTATPITSSQRAALTKAAVSSLQQYVALPISVGGSRRRPLSFVALDGDSEGEATTTATSLDEKTAENQDAKETEPKARPVRRRIPRERPPPITLVSRQHQYLMLLVLAVASAFICVGSGSSCHGDVCVCLCLCLCLCVAGVPAPDTYVRCGQIQMTISCCNRFVREGDVAGVLAVRRKRCKRKSCGE